MEFDPVNLIYFAITIPLVNLIYFAITIKVREKHLISIAILGVLVFLVRFVLVLFADTIGIMPYLEADIIFYTLLAIFGIIVTIIYVKKVEHSSLKELGWEVKDPKRSVLYGFLFYIPLVCFIPLLLLLTGIEVSYNITWEKIVLGLEFGLVLGGFFEEVMFRGIIQKHFLAVTSEKRVILFTALVFTATHIFYLPFIGFGVYYLFVFVMALLLSYLRLKVDLLACFILHGGIVFILIIFV